MSSDNASDGGIGREVEGGATGSSRPVAVIRTSSADVRWAAMWLANTDTDSGSADLALGSLAENVQPILLPAIAGGFRSYRTERCLQPRWTGRFDLLLYWSRLNSTEMLFTPSSGTRSPRADEIQATPAFRVWMVSIQ